ncbi:unnamed protein product, partial [Pedinophyceae sp. YPF-701]
SHLNFADETPDPSAIGSKTALRRLMSSEFDTYRCKHYVKCPASVITSNANGSGSNNNSSSTLPGSPVLAPGAASAGAGSAGGRRPRAGSANRAENSGSDNTLPSLPVAARNAGSWQPDAAAPPPAWLHHAAPKRSSATANNGARRGNHRGRDGDEMMEAVAGLVELGGVFDDDDEPPRPQPAAVGAMTLHLGSGPTGPRYTDGALDGAWKSPASLAWAAGCKRRRRTGAASLDETAPRAPAGGQAAASPQQVSVLAPSSPSSGLTPPAAGSPASTAFPAALLQQTLAAPSQHDAHALQRAMLAHSGPGGTGAALSHLRSILQALSAQAEGQPQHAPGAWTSVPASPRPSTDQGARPAPHSILQGLASLGLDWASAERQAASQL